jgi:hypothetical protein
MEFSFSFSLLIYIIFILCFVYYIYCNYVFVVVNIIIKLFIIFAERNSFLIATRPVCSERIALEY